MTNPRTCRLHHARHPRHAQATVLALLLAALAACTTPQTANHYARPETRMLQQVQFGAIVDVRAVVLDATPSGQGAAAGALLGSLPGAQGGSANRAAIGAVVGSLLGQGVEDAANRRPGVELLVRLDDGNHVAITQETDGLAYLPGQRVRVITLNGSARVVHQRPAATPAGPATAAAD